MTPRVTNTPGIDHPAETMTTPQLLSSCKENIQTLMRAMLSGIFTKPTFKFLISLLSLFKPSSTAYMWYKKHHCSSLEVEHILKQCSLHMKNIQDKGLTECHISRTLVELKSLTLISHCSNGLSHHHKNRAQHITNQRTYVVVSQWTRVRAVMPAGRIISHHGADSHWLHS